MVTSLRTSHSCTATPRVPTPVAGHHQPMPSVVTPGRSWQVWVGLLWGHCPFLLGSDMHKFLSAIQVSVSPILSMFWRFYGGVNGDLLQEGLCHTQVCCTQSPRHCGWPLLTNTFAGGTQKQFWLSPCVGSLGPGAHKVCLGLLSISGR